GDEGGIKRLNAGGAGLGGKVGADLSEDGTQFGITHRQQIIACALKVASAHVPNLARQASWHMDDEHALALMEILLDRDVLRELLIDSRLGAPGLGEGGRAHDFARAPIGDSEKNMSTAFVGQGHAVAKEFVEFVTVGGGLELDARRSEEHTSELQSRENLVCRLLLEKKK